MNRAIFLAGAIGIVSAAGATFGLSFHRGPRGINTVVGQSERIARVRVRSVVVRTYELTGPELPCGQIVAVDVVESFDGESTPFEFFLPKLPRLKVGEEYLAIVSFYPDMRFADSESVELSQLEAEHADRIRRCRRYAGLRAGYMEQSVFEIVRGSEGGAVPPGEWLVELSYSALEGDDIVLDRRRFSESNYRSSETIVPWSEVRAAIIEAFREKTTRQGLEPTPTTE